MLSILGLPYTLAHAHLLVPLSRKFVRVPVSQLKYKSSFIAYTFIRAKPSLSANWIQYEEVHSFSFCCYIGSILTLALQSEPCDLRTQGNYHGDYWTKLLTVQKFSKFEGICRNPREFAGIRRNPRELEGIRGNQRESEGISGNQKELAGIGRNKQECTNIIIVLF